MCNDFQISFHSIFFPPKTNVGILQRPTLAQSFFAILKKFLDLEKQVSHLAQKRFNQNFGSNFVFKMLFDQILVSHETTQFVQMSSLNLTVRSKIGTSLIEKQLLDQKLIYQFYLNETQLIKNYYLNENLEEPNQSRLPHFKLNSDHY